MNKNTILCLTHSHDYFTIDRVQLAIEHRGYKSVRFNTDSFPHASKLSTKIDSKGRMQATFQSEDVIVPAESIAAVWVRKVAQPQIPLTGDEGKNHPYLNQCINESEAARTLFFNCLSHIPWIDRLDIIARCEDKGLQLQAAGAAGMQIPATLISNDPDAARQFYQTHQSRIVTKMLTPLCISMNRPNNFVYTSRVTEKHLENLDGLRFSPMIFQAEVDKAYELRVVYVAGQCFCGKIFTATATENTQVDWRRAKMGECHWQPHQLDSTVIAQIDKTMKRLGLYFGAIDLIVTPEGETIFLEVNPTGEWGMLEKHLDLPIADAIADTLISKANENSKQYD